MEAVVTKDWEGKTQLVCLVWEDNELDKMYFIPGITNYSRTSYNSEAPARDAFNKFYDNLLYKLLWQRSG